MFPEIMIITAFILVIALFILGKVKTEYSGIFGCVSVVLCILAVIFSGILVKNTLNKQTEIPVGVETQKEVEVPEKALEEQVKENGESDAE